MKDSIYFLASLFGLLFLFTTCSTPNKITRTSGTFNNQNIHLLKLGGGASGMEQINDSSYLIVYDLKNYTKGIRLGMVIVTDDTINVTPIEIDSWDKEGISNDLESICIVPGKVNEYLIAESGNWQGGLGRIFHIQFDISRLKAKVLSSVKLPLLHRNDLGLTGDNYEALYCLAYSEHERIVILGERGGSQCNPSGILRWGLWNIKNSTLSIKGKGLKGVNFNAPGNWLNTQFKRSITDIYVDEDDIIWASASEDQGDAGPFYSVIYKLGKIDQLNQKEPFMIFDKLTIGIEIPEFKIEALSGPKKGITCTHTFGTDDENYGGVWGPININQ